MLLIRSAIGPHYGDHNILRTSGTTPQNLYASSQYLKEEDDRWISSLTSSAESLIGHFKSLHPRYLQVPASKAAYHFFHATGFAPLKALFGCGTTTSEESGLVYLRRVTNNLITTVQSGALTAGTYTELSDTGGYSRYVVSAECAGGQTQRIDDVRVYEYLDLDPIIQDLAPFQSDYDPQITPYDREYAYTKNLETGGSTRLTLLIDRNSANHKILEAFAKPDNRARLELSETIGNFQYLLPVAIRNLSLQPAGGLLLEASLDLVARSRYAVHTKRQISLTTSAAQQIDYSSNNPDLLAPTPAEIRIRISAYSASNVTVWIQPSGQKIVFAPDAVGIWSLYDDGRLYKTTYNAATAVTDKTSLIASTSPTPPVISPRYNHILIDPGSHTISDWGAYWYPRIGLARFA